MPCNKALSLDLLFGLTTSKKDSFYGGIARRLLQLQLSLVYFSTGIEKLMSNEWWNGEAIWRVLMIPSFKHFNFDWISNFPLLPKILGWLVLAIELSYPVLIWVSSTRRFALYSIILLHLGIGKFMGLWMFSFIMIILSLFCFGNRKYFLLDGNLFTSQRMLFRRLIKVNL